MREMKKQTIDGIEYGLYPLNPFKSLPIFTKVTKILGPTLLKLVVGASSGDKKKSLTSVLDSDMSEILEKMSDNIDSFFVNLSEKELEDIIKRLLPADLLTADENKVQNIEAHFGRHGLLHLFKVAKFALEVNFKDFLPANLEA